MKKYRLKQWYPSLQKKTIEGNIANWDDDEKAYTVIQNGNRVEILDKTEVENNPDFWELIEDHKPKPLFITEDDVKFFSETSREFYIVVNFIKYRSTISDFEDQKKLSHKVFYHESNADTYIWKNNRVFSYEDIIEHAYNNPKYRIYIEKLAKERSKE